MTPWLWLIIIGGGVGLYVSLVPVRSTLSRRGTTAGTGGSFPQSHGSHLLRSWWAEGGRPRM